MPGMLSVEALDGRRRGLSDRRLVRVELDCPGRRSTTRREDIVRHSSDFERRDPAVPTT